MAWDLAGLTGLGLPIVGAAAGAVGGGTASESKASPSEEPEFATASRAVAAVGAGTKRSCHALQQEHTPSSIGTSPAVAVANVGCCAVQEVQRTMEEKAAALGLASAYFLAVEPGYYEQTLEWRRDRLGATSVEELCKSVVLENTKRGEDAELGRIRCVLVLVQYVAKLNKEKLIRTVQAMEASKGLPALGKKQYNMRLLEGDTCAALTGFQHNAVTPLGLDLPMVLSDKISTLPSGCFWLGGGHVDLKLRWAVSRQAERRRGAGAAPSRRRRCDGLSRPLAARSARSLASHGSRRGVIVCAQGSNHA